MGRKGWILLTLCAVVAVVVAVILYTRSRQADLPVFGILHPQTDSSAVAATVPAGGTQAVNDQTAAPASSTHVVTYKVRRGDTLGAISRRYLGSSTKWHLIAKENGLRSSFIKPGMELHIALASAN